MVDLGEPVAMDVDPPEEDLPPHDALRIAFWNAQRISGNSNEDKRMIAHTLRAYGSDIILCEAVGDLEDFELVAPVKGAGRPRKLKSMFFREHVAWAEVDTIGQAFELGALDHKEYRIKAGARNAGDVVNAKLRRPLVGKVNLKGTVWGLAALHAPAGGAKNSLNLTTLYATMWWLHTHFGDHWVLFGDLNLDPRTDAKGRNNLAWWVLGYLNDHVGYPVVPKLDGPTHKDSVLDYALCPAAVAGAVTVKVLADFEGVSDHRPIHLLLTP